MGISNLLDGVMGISKIGLEMSHYKNRVTVTRMKANKQ